jgi:peptidoglycan/LPS O-acetylase OafA/YrhL
MLLFCYGRFTTHLFPFGYGEFQDIPVGLAAAGLVVAAFSWAPLSAFLVSKPIDWLGTESYSLYLIHGTVLFALVNVLNLSRPNLFLLPLYLALALVFTHLFYITVERPLVLISRRFAPERMNSTPAILSPIGPEPPKSFVSK